MIILAQNQKAIINTDGQSIVVAPTAGQRWSLSTTGDKCLLGLFKSEEEAKSTLREIFIHIANGEEAYSVRKENESDRKENPDRSTATA